MLSQYRARAYTIRSFNIMKTHAIQLRTASAVYYPTTHPSAPLYTDESLPTFLNIHHFRNIPFIINNRRCVTTLPVTKKTCVVTRKQEQIYITRIYAVYIFQAPYAKCIFNEVLCDIKIIYFILWDDFFFFFVFWVF